MTMNATVTLNVTYDHRDDAKAEDVHDLLTALMSMAAASDAFSSRWAGGDGVYLRAENVHHHIKVKGPERFVYHSTPSIEALSDDELTEAIHKTDGEARKCRMDWGGVLSSMGRDFPDLPRQALISKAMEQNSELGNRGSCLEHELFMLKNEFEHRVREGQYE